MLMMPFAYRQTIHNAIIMSFILRMYLPINVITEYYTGSRAMTHTHTHAHIHAHTHTHTHIDKHADSDL